MRILHVVHQYLPEHVGGSELYTQTVAQAAAAAGHTVTVFTRAAAPKGLPGVGARSDSADGVTVTRVWDGDLGATRRYLANFGGGALLAAFERTLAATRPDVVHIQHAIGLPLALLDRPVAAGIPFVISLHDYWWVCANSQLITDYDHTVCGGPVGYVNCTRCAVARAGAAAWPVAPALWGSLAWRGKRLVGGLAHAAALLAPTRFVAEWYAAHGAPRTTLQVLPLGVDRPPGFCREPSPHTPLRLGLLGGLVRQKGSHIAVDAVAALGDRVELWVAGADGPDAAYAAALRRRATPNVRFLGPLDRAEVWRLLAQVDALLVPSLSYETYSYALHEALAAGVPVLASDLGAMAGAVTDGVTGRLAPPGDVTAWAKALAEWAADPTVLTRLAAAIRPPLTVAAHVAQLLTVYAKAAGKA
jgi:glycosyltransferase involved in cell wall biosynthesis